MLKSLLIKIPALVLVALIFALVSGPKAWLLALLVIAVDFAILMAIVFDVNSSFWAPTLFRAPSDRKSVALTFDDGPDPIYTPRVLDVLAAKNVSATFFCVGERVQKHPELVQRIANAGHIVANHSFTHDLRFHFRLWASVRRELAACNDAIRSAIGREPALFRSPQGFKNPALGDVLRASGMKTIGWQVRGFDAFERDADVIAKRIVDGVRPGGVVLLHDGAGLNGTRDREPTLKALPVVIDALRASGLEIVPLDELLGLAAYR